MCVTEQIIVCLYSQTFYFLNMTFYYILLFLLWKDPMAEQKESVFIVEREVLL